MSRVLPDYSQGFTGTNISKMGPRQMGVDSEGRTSVATQINAILDALYTFHDDGTADRPPYLPANGLWMRANADGSKDLCQWDGQNDGVLASRLADGTFLPSPLAAAPSEGHPDGVAGIVIPDGKSIILNASKVAASPHLPGVANFQALTISSGAISPTVADVIVDTEGAAAADELTAINVAEAQNGMILRLWAVNEARVITVKHSSTLQLAGEVDRVLSQHGYLELKRNGAYWQETPRKDVLELQATYTANNTYSSTRWDTGRKWINGKTVWGKYINFGAMPNNTLKEVASGETVETLINCRLWGERNSDGIHDTQSMENYSSIVVYNYVSQMVGVRPTSDQRAFTAGRAIIYFTTVSGA